MKSVLLVGYKALADVAGKGSLFLITIVAARRLAPHAFGTFALASTLGWILAVATDFGIQLHLARVVAQYPSEAGRLLRASLRVRLGTAASALALVGAGVAMARPGGAVAAAIMLFAATYVVSALVELLHYFYRALGRSDIESTLIVWQRTATLACALLALAWRPDVTLLGAAMLLPVLATFALSLRIANRLGHSVQGSSEPAPSAPLFVDFRRDVLPIGAGIVLSALYFRIDVFLVQAWCGTDAVAQYNAVFRLVEALRLFPAAVLAVALPALCRAGDARPLANVSLAVTAFAGLVTAGLWAAAGWTIPLVYGAAYAGAVPTFRILLLSFPLLSLNYALTHQLIGWNQQRAYAALCGLALAVNLALNARLIPTLSIDGAAWATLGTEGFLTAGCVVALWTRRAPRQQQPAPAGFAS